MKPMATLRRGLHRDAAAVLLALIFLVVAAVLPRFSVDRPVYDYLVALDITQSMDVEDMRIDGAPASRLAAARAAARELLKRLPCGSRIGWAAFTDYRTIPLLLPVEVCSHYEELLASLERIDGRMRWANASNVGKGLTWAIRTTRELGPRTRTVFFTDGQESPPLREQGDLPPMPDITPGDVRGWIVGVGGDLPARIPRTDGEGNAAGYWAAADVVQRFRADTPGTPHEHLSELRQPYLEALAKLTGLGYRRLDTPAALAEALLDPQLGRLAPVAVDMRWVPALLGLLALALHFMPGLMRRMRESNG